MTIIKATAAEDLQIGDLVSLEPSTLSVRRHGSKLTEERNCIGIANQKINVGDKLVMDLRTGRLTKDGKDVLDQSGGN